MADGHGRRLGAGIRAELGEEVADVRVHLARADEEGFANLAVGFPLHQQAQDIVFTRSEAEAAGVVGGLDLLSGICGDGKGVRERVGNRELLTLFPGGDEHRLREACP